MTRPTILRVAGGVLCAAILAIPTTASPSMAQTAEPGAIDTAQARDGDLRDGENGLVATGSGNGSLSGEGPDGPDELFATPTESPTGSLDDSGRLDSGAADGAAGSPLVPGETLAQGDGQTSLEPGSETNGSEEPDAGPKPLTPEQIEAQAELQAATKEYGRIQTEMRAAFEAVAKLTTETEDAARDLRRERQRLGDAESALSQAAADTEVALGEQVAAGRIVDAAREEMFDSASGAYRSSAGGDAEVVGLLQNGELGKARTAQIYRGSLLTHLDDVARQTQDALDVAEDRFGSAQDAEAEAGRSRDRAETRATEAQTKFETLSTFLELGTERFESLSAEAEGFGQSRAQMAALAIGERADLDGIGQLLNWAQTGQVDWDFAARPLRQPLESLVMTSPFGQRFHPVYKTWRLHRGIDYGAASGTPVLAPADGIVFLAEVRGGYGNAVVIDHGNSLATVNAHLSAYNVAAGDEVKAGDVVGFVGSTGVSTGPHLHFETRLRGAAVQPLAFGLVDPDDYELADSGADGEGQPGLDAVPRAPTEGGSELQPPEALQTSTEASAGFGSETSTGGP